MLASLVSACLARRGTVLALAAAFLVYGLFTAAHAPLDVLPDFAPPQVVVQCEAPGFAAEQVERLVTAPIEAALAGTAGLAAVRSQSIQGLAIVTAQFDDGSDPLRARQQVAEQLVTLAGVLPDGVAAPALAPLTSATMDLLKIGLLSDRLGPMELREFADMTLAPRLRAVPGVASVSVLGGEVRELQVAIDPGALAVAGIGFEQLAAAVRRATGVSGAGYVDSPAQRVVVETHGQTLAPEELAQGVIEWRDGRPLRIGDVARVVAGAAPKFGDCLIQGRPGVLVKLLSQLGANTLAATRAAEAALAELRPAFAAQGIELFPALHRPANFVETAVTSLGHSLWIGAGLVAIVLFLFLADVSAALISLTAIPLSLLAAVVVLTRLGLALDTMTLGGLAIAIGEVVDDAIIDVENIARRLRENAASGGRRSAFAVVLAASLEVRGAVVHATFVVVAVFVPVMAMSGLQGRFFAPLGIAYVAAVVASLAVALTVTPALALLLLGRRDAAAREPRLVARLRSAYARAIRRFVGRPWLAVGGALLAIAGAAVALPFLGSEFLPEFREGHFVLQLSLAPGASIEEMKRVGERASAALLSNPHVATIEQQIGRSALSEDPWGPHRSEFHIELARLPDDVEAGVGDEIRAVLDHLPGIQYELLTFLGDRIGESISGETASVVVNVFGEELEVLDGVAADVAEQLASVRGAVDVQRGALPGMPLVEVELRRERLAASGFAAADVLEAVELAYQGATLQQVHDGPRTIDVVARLAAGSRRDPGRIGELLLRSPAGQLVPLAELARIELRTGRQMVLHEGGRRRQTVTCNVRGRDVASFVDEARRQLDRGLTLPAGTYLTFAGAAEQERAARNELLLHGALALLAVLLLLGAAFGNARNLLLALLNLPFGLVGGVLAAAATGGTLSMGSLVGFVTLFGVTMRNSIMLLSHIEHVVVHEEAPFGVDSVVRAAAERLVPILMTALVTGLGLLPIALCSGSAGREIEGPMAIVIVGGLASSTLLNLALLPTLALRFGRFGPAAA